MRQPVISIVDYGIGNTYSILGALKFLGYRKIKVSANAEDFFVSDALILPGVGAFQACMHNLKSKHLDDVLNDVVMGLKKPILGICVGMQMMATFSEEDGLHNGLNWIPGRVVKLKALEHFAVPHVGWNDLELCKESLIYNRTQQKPNLYFDHSYHYRCDEKYITAECNYSHPITASIEKDKIYGVQYHPEKSHDNGLRIFRSFLSAI